MHNRWLKRLRVILSLLFFLVMTGLFLDFSGNIHRDALLLPTHLQFVPSLILFFGTGTIIGLGFVLVLLLTLLFGRIYCSTLCPMGTIQDIFIYLKNKLSPKRTIFKFKKPHNLLRYIILSVVALSVLTGSLLLVNLTDPYSMFGKIAHNLFQPALILINNLASEAHHITRLYVLYPVKWVPVNLVALFLALGWIILVFVLSFRRGRLYCNTVCPVGAVLGLVSKVSLFRIRLDHSKCNSCGKCSAVCKAECINPKNQSLDFSRCVGCMNCLSPCPDSGVQFVPFWLVDALEIKDYDPNRRKFIGNTGIIVAASLAAKNTLAQDTLQEKKREVIPASVPIFRQHPVTPPGSIDRNRFNSLCTACHLCVSACPTQVLQPTVILYGLSGFLQPRMDYITSFCNFECTICGKVCPTGAILELPLEEKKLVQMGKAKFVKENCIVYTKNTACGACSEHCPTKAVKMVPYKDKLTIPETTDNICIGCGACEYACPTDPKSIYVEGNPVHLLAEKPKDEKVEEKIDYKEEFPF